MGAPAPAYGGVVIGSRRGENVPTGLELARRRFSERARNQKSQPPRMPLLRWTRTRRSLEQAPQRLRMAEWLLVRARGTDKEGTPEACLWGSFFMRSPDWTRTSNPSINSRMLCQLSYGGLFCFRCWFPLQRVITIPGLFGLRNLKCYEVHHFWGVWLVWVVREASTPRYSPATCRTQDIRQVAGAFTRNRT